jgi:hypothetical protein
MIEEMSGVLSQTASAHNVNCTVSMVGFGLYVHVAVTGARSDDSNLHAL